MAEVLGTERSPQVGNTDSRWVHRMTCVLAGGLALVGGILAIAIDPWFVALAAVGGVWLIVAPEPQGCRSR